MTLRVNTRWAITTFAGIAFFAGCAYLVLTRNVITGVEQELTKR